MFTIDSHTLSLLSALSDAETELACQRNHLSIYSGSIDWQLFDHLTDSLNRVRAEITWLTTYRIVARARSGGAA